MNGDRRLRFVHRYWPDEDFVAKCKTSKISLMKWLKISNFEVIYCCTDSLGNTKLYHDFNSLPKDILDNKIGYGIQLSREIADSPQLSVTPADSSNVFLEYVFDWN
ncbi:MAG TPA: hypothetical protein VNZ49_00115 [Bacteroidia bacterium]|nr:hypothetical protein [Bacteroidia bacterium]